MRVSSRPRNAADIDQGIRGVGSDRAMTRSRGFTLLELVIVIAVGGVLTTWTAHTIILSTSASQRVVGTLHGLNVMRDVIYWIERDITEAQGARIERSSKRSTRLTLNGPKGSRIEYSCAAGTLRRNGQAIATRIDSMQIEGIDLLGHATRDTESTTALMVTFRLGSKSGSLEVKRFVPLANLTFPYTGMRN